MHIYKWGNKYNFECQGARLICGLYFQRGVFNGSYFANLPPEAARTCSIWPCCDIGSPTSSSLLIKASSLRKIANSNKNACTRTQNHSTAHTHTRTPRSRVKIQSSRLHELFALQFLRSLRFASIFACEFHKARSRISHPIARRSIGTGVKFTFSLRTHNINALCNCK